MPDTPDPEGMSDEELVIQIQSGGSNKFINVLFARYAKKSKGWIIFALGRSPTFYKPLLEIPRADSPGKAGRAPRLLDFIYQEAADIFQDAWLKMIDHIRSYNPEKGKFSTWFHAIVENIINDYWKGRNNLPRPTEDDKLEFIAAGPPGAKEADFVPDSVIVSELRRIALEAFEEIPNEDYRAAFYLRVLTYDIFSEEELADLLGRQFSTLRSDISRGREEWEKAVERRFGDSSLSGILDHIQKGGGVFMDRAEMLGRIRDERARKAFDLRLRIGADYEAIAKELGCGAGDVKDMLGAALLDIAGSRKVRGAAAGEDKTLSETERNRVFFEAFDLLSKNREISARPTRGAPVFEKEQAAAKLLFSVMRGFPRKQETLGDLLIRASQEQNKSFDAIAKEAKIGVDEFACLLSGAKKPSRKEVSGLSKALGMPAGKLQAAAQAASKRTAARATRGAGQKMLDWDRVERDTLKLLHQKLKENKNDR